MATGLVQEFFPAFGQKSSKQSMTDNVEARVGALASHGFTSFKNSVGLRSAIDHLVVSPRGLFLIYTERRRPSGSGMVTIPAGKGRWGRIVRTAQWEQEAVGRSLQVPESFPVRSLICVPGGPGSNLDLFLNGVKVVAVGDLARIMLEFPSVLSAHQVVALSALVWVRLRLR